MHVTCCIAQLVSPKHLGCFLAMKPSLKEPSRKILALQKTGTTKIKRVLEYYSDICKISAILVCLHIEEWRHLAFQSVDKPTSSPAFTSSTPRKNKDPANDAENKHPKNCGIFIHIYYNEIYSGSQWHKNSEVQNLTNDCTFGCC